MTTPFWQSESDAVLASLHFGFSAHRSDGGLHVNGFVRGTRLGGSGHDDQRS